MKKWMTIVLTVALMASLVIGAGVTANAAGEDLDGVLAELIEAVGGLQDTLDGLADADDAPEAVAELQDMLATLQEKAAELEQLAAEAAEAPEEAAEEPEEAAEAPEETAEEPEEETAEEPEAIDLEGLDRIGEETEEGYKVVFTNLTGSEIMGMNIQKSGSDTWDWSAEMLADGDRFVPDEAAVFCYTPGEGEDEQTTYNVQIVFTDWTVGYLHYVALSDMQQAELHRASNSLPYLVYTSLSSAEQIDTSAAEQKAFEGELEAGFWDSVVSSGSSSGSSSSGGSSSGGSSSSGGCVGSDALFN